jgi:hypothetical protein
MNPITKSQQLSYRSKKPKEKRESTIKQLDANAWKWCSRMVRVEEAVNPDYVYCFTCKKLIRLVDAECGHFVQRNRLATKFKRQNLHSQCTRCNKFLSGNQAVHGIEIDKQYGEGTAKHLILLGSIRGAKIGRLEYERMIEEFKAITNKLVKDKGINKWW